MRNLLLVLTLLGGLMGLAVKAVAEITNLANGQLQPVTPVDERVREEGKAPDNPFLINLYRPNYILPIYYNSQTNQAVYEDHTPNQEQVRNLELSYQFSFKVPLWSHFFRKKSTLYAAYSQKSFWQAYTNSAFFRETDYEPEVFVANYLKLPVFDGWQLNFLNPGFDHQSNGFGGELERSWNRVYLEAVLARNDWAVSVKPWYIIPDSSLHRYNPDIATYMGHASLLIAYNYHRQTVALETANNLESGFKYGQLRLTWSFPLREHLKGFVQLFSGYGQSLIEYDHYNNSIGIGLAINDWV